MYKYLQTLDFKYHNIYQCTNSYLCQYKKYIQYKIYVFMSSQYIKFKGGTTIKSVWVLF